ncbi:MAG: hypothetical protein NTU69_09440 [Proteobacteria bacterium]|nr:hypothetical protein [Pseudomonadota bacterium]
MQRALRAGEGHLLTEEEEKSLDTKEGSEEIDKSLYIEMKKNPSLRWSIGNGMFTFQAASPNEWLLMTRAYTMKGIADKIRCRMLAY